MEMMSSDQSDGEVIQIKELPWLSSRVTDFINSLERGMETPLRARSTTDEAEDPGGSDRPPASVAPSWGAANKTYEL
jgi:hypothetical protein